MAPKVGSKNARQLQGVEVSSTAPSDTQVLKYDAASTKWTPSAADDHSARLLAYLGV